MADEKLLVDCSKPVDHPAHVVMKPLTKQEIAQRARDAKKAVVRPDPRAAAAEAIEGAETLEDVKAALAAYLRGG